MRLARIDKVANKIDIPESALEYYGNYKAKISRKFIDSVKNNKDGKLVLVTAITPTKAGEGKTTASIALLDGLAKINKKALLSLREPSLGPVFGLKGGATGGGKVTVEPQEDINLHFTGDMHALTSAINLIAAVIDNHIYQGNELQIDQNKILWKRAMDMNERELREIEIGLGGPKNGIQRRAQFEITVASELMAILCIATDENDFIERIKKIIVAYNLSGEPVYLNDLRISKAVLKLLKSALLPNIVQTREGNPVLIHGGPFANIAHGCSSLTSIKLAQKISPITITEAGFGADLGAEKFLDITSKIGGLTPDAIVLVATIRALKLHGGVKFEELSKENVQALEEGFKNLEQHYYNLRKFDVPVVVAINHFKDDTDEEISFMKNKLASLGIKFAFLDGFLKGGDGSVELALKVDEVLMTTKTKYHTLYNYEDSIEDKIECLAKKIYHAESVEFSEKAKADIEEIRKLNRTNLPICVAKTPASFSDDPTLLNVPRGFTFHVREVKLSNGAGFIVCLCGSVLTMPGLPKIPAAVKMEDEE